MNKSAPKPSETELRRAEVPRHPTTEHALRLPQVCQVTGLRRSTIYQLQSERRFPQRIKLSDRAVGWLEREVQDWLAQRIESARSGKPNPKAQTPSPPTLSSQSSIRR